MKKKVINSVKRMYAKQKIFKGKEGMVEFLTFETRQKIILTVTNKDDKNLYCLVELLKKQKEAIANFPNS
jgi:hypothetical protein